MGQVKKLRSCPAVHREITAAECGENRISRYACPQSCKFNPFASAHYDALLKVEDRLDALSLEHLLEETADPDALKADAAKAFSSASLHARHAFFVWQLFLRRDAAGTTSAERWERAGFPGLKNDERVLLRAKMQTRVVLLEIQCVRDHELIDAAELLAPETHPRRFLDRSLAARATRFSVMLGWAFPMPYLWRLSGSAAVLPSINDIAPTEAIGEIIRHLGGSPSDSAAQRLWLAENFVRVDAAITAVAYERRRLTFAALDMTTGVASYELTVTPAAARRELDRATEMAVDQLSPRERSAGFDSAWDWFDDSPVDPRLNLPGGRALLGRVLLGKKVCQLEATALDRLRRLRVRFEGHMGGKVRFTSERIENIGAQMALREPASDPSLIPPRLLQNPAQFSLGTTSMKPPSSGKSAPEMVAEAVLQSKKKWLDEPVPVLDGQTPRFAAKDARLRPALLRLVKQMINQTDENNLRQRTQEDLGWLVRELALTEIDFPPPPVRSLKTSEGVEEEDFDDELPLDDYKRTGVPGRHAAPPLPSKPLSEPEISQRLEQASSFATAKDAILELEASGSAMLDQLDDLTGDLLAEEEFNFLLTVALLAWFALVPRGVQAPSLRQPEMMRALEARLRRLEGALKSPSPDLVTEVLSSDSRQPALMQALFIQVLDSSMSGPRKLRTDPDAVPIMLAILHTLIDELDFALREPT